ncbi:hypothetical protein [Syntrophomonas wolfei]|jgi:hypothetical protein|uniref:Uncharacterized protein n=1 Tax=Syntrophomonas wolfei TaxID=863 RepID=A0A354YVV5_9FIRM|nr:hypothetical protein [Syntrophomonas wolfei]HBK52372.1 hypothetical protein [Syntrophomonas wolfei]
MTVCILVFSLCVLLIVLILIKRVKRLLRTRFGPTFEDAGKESVMMSYAASGLKQPANGKRVLEEKDDYENKNQ